MNAYTFEHVLGKGGFGVVRQATDRTNGTKVAVKSIDLKKLRKVDSQAHIHLTREVQLMRTLNHPGIVRLCDEVGETSHYHLVLELCNGPDMKKVLDFRGALSEDEGRGITRQLLVTLSFLHGKMIVHRDIKPGNVLLVEPLTELQDNLESASVKLCDFGMGRQLLDPRSKSQPSLRRSEISPTKIYCEPSSSAFDDTQNLSPMKDYELTPGTPYTSSSEITRVGTRAYASPELTEESIVTDKVLMTWKNALNLDMYALGQTLRHMLTGVSPDENVKDRMQIMMIVARLATPLRGAARCCCASSRLASAGMNYTIREMSELSPAANDLYRMLTASNICLAMPGEISAKRITAVDACTHPWILSKECIDEEFGVNTQALSGNDAIILEQAV